VRVENVDDTLGPVLHDERPGVVARPFLEHPHEVGVALDEEERRVRRHAVEDELAEDPVSGAVLDDDLVLPEVDPLADASDQKGGGRHDRRDILILKKVLDVGEGPGESRRHGTGGAIAEDQR
jgi:hypothetical protein